jgi:YesN/AraC family two-component response regulator
VLEAPNGKDALSVAGRFEEEIDILFTDAVMPRLSGPELARELLKSRPRMRVLVTSGYVDREKSDIGPEAAFLEKPFTPDALGRKVREVLDSPRGKRA